MKKFRVSLIILVILSILAVILITRNRKDTFQKFENSFAVDDTTNITKIFLTDKFNNSSLLEKQGDSAWTLNNKYVVNKPVLQTMLYTLISIKANQKAPKAARESILKRMSVSGTKIEVYQRVYRVKIGKMKLFPHEKKSRVYYVGDVTQDNRGTYMLMEGAENPYIVFIPGLRGFVASRYSAKENDWRSHEMINLKLPQIKEISLIFPGIEGYSLILQNNDNRSFRISDPLTGTSYADFDTLRVIEFLGSFKRINYEAIQEVLTDKQKDSINAVMPFCELKVTDKQGKTKEFTFWKRKTEPGELDIEGNPVEWDNENLFALEKGTNEFLLVQFFVFDKIFRPMPWFLKNPEILKPQS